MIFNVLIAALTAKNLRGEKKSPRSRYLNEKYQERSITNRYFK